MGWLDRCRGDVEQLKDGIDGAFVAYKHGDLPYALPAVAALIATAKGALPEGDIAARAEVFARYDGLRSFHLAMLRDRFTLYCQQGQDTFERYEVERLVARLQDTPEAVLAARFGVLIVLDDHDAGPGTAAAIALDKICDLLGLEPEQVLPVAA